MDNGGYLDTTSSKGLIPASVNPPSRSGRLENCQRILAFMSYQIEPLQSSDWNEVRSIYEEGIATGNATFETEAPSWERWDTSHLFGCRLVARGPDGILGWAALSPVSSRRVYAGVAEASVYVAGASQGQGVGRSLLTALWLPAGGSARALGTIAWNMAGCDPAGTSKHGDRL
jgi:L-amino acid N-acyltransferase YncA